MHTHSDQDELLDRGGHPTLREILKHLVFSPFDGSIMLNDARLVLQRASYNAHLRDELVRRYGRHDARVLLTRLGYRAGVEDARFVLKSWPHIDRGDAFTAGTRLHNVNGIVRVETIHNDFDFDKRKYSSEFLWHDSAEAMEYLAVHGPNPDASCWSQLGYASGYACHFFNDLIVFKEVQCAAAGHPHCRVVGKAARTWGEDDETVRMYREEVIQTPRVVAPPRTTEQPQVRQADFGTPVAACLLAPFTPHLERVDRAEVPLLITGPRGAGKRMAAHYLHRITAGPGAPFRRLSCSGLSADGLTQALTPRSKAGTLNRRTGERVSTLLLEDIEQLSDSAQVRLVELLETDRDAADNPLDVQLVVTSTLPLDEITGSPNLRSDLAHRLAILPLHMPPLSERRGDLAELATAVLRTESRRRDRPMPELTEAALALLTSRDYPGNFPEFETLLIRTMLSLGDCPLIDASDIARSDLTAAAGTPGAVADAPPGGEPDSLDRHLLQALSGDGLAFDRLNQRIYKMAMAMSGGNVSGAARLLGLSRAQLAYRLRQHTGEGGVSPE